MSLPFTPFGSTGLKVTRLGLGLAALGRPGYINLGHGEDLEHQYKEEEMQRKASEVLEEAWNNGIRYFDVARSYGKGELFLSNWLKTKQGNDGIVVGSKWGYTYTAGWKVEAEKHEVKEHSIEVLEKQWPESKKLIGDHLKVYHIHSATLESGVIDNKAVLDKLWELKGKGIVVGLSLSGAKQKETLEKALTIKKGNQHLFQSVQATYNILEPSVGSILKKASESGYGVIIKEAVANGRLTQKNKEEDFRGKMEVLQNLAKKYEAGIDALAIAFVLNQPWVSTVLSGASTIKQLNSNFQAIKVKISKEDLRLLEELKETPEDYWNQRSALSWN